MAIAGVKPVERVHVFDDVFGSPVEDYFKAEKDYYTAKQVREILVKYRNQLSPEYDQYGNRWIENDDVDEFMESGEE